MNTELVRVVILMRHGMRAPFADNHTYTPHRWFHNPFWQGQLTRRGRCLCSRMGLWMRRELQEKGLSVLSCGNVKVFANRSPRTFASAQAFTEGLTGSRFHTVEAGAGEARLFTPELTGISTAFQVEAEKQAAEAVHARSIASVPETLQHELALLWRILRSPKDLDMAETKLILQNGHGPCLEGSLQTAATIADTLICRHMLNPFFQKKTEDQEWRELSRICDTRRSILFGSDIIVRNALGTFLLKLDEELREGMSTCTLLCGHDSTVKAVMTALNIAPYALPGSLFGEIPPSCCLNMEIYRGEEDRYFIHFRIVYPLDSQLFGRMPLDKHYPPGSQSLFLKNMPADGELYLLDDVSKLLTGRHGNDARIL